MTGETDLSQLLSGLKPELQPGEYVFCTLPDDRLPMGAEPIGLFRESEGVTVILAKSQADAVGLPYAFVGAWITVTVHSALNAVGLTAAISQALTTAGISCNVVAAYYHDHLFVPVDEAERSLSVLHDLSRRSANSDRYRLS